jgi:hypothetical protein
MFEVRLEVVERPIRFINVFFIEVCLFSRRQSCILHTVRTEGCVGMCILRTVCAFPLVNLCTLIFELSIFFFCLLMDFGVVGELIFVGIDVFIQPLCAMLRTIFQ